MIDNVPIVVVDDEGEENILPALRLAQNFGKWQGREIELYTTLDSALELLVRRDPFVLVLDHNLNAGRNPELAARLGADPGEELFGYHLCGALRQQHTFGLAIPVAYLTAWVSGPKYLEILSNQGPFLPNFWMDKNTMQEHGHTLAGLVDSLDTYQAALMENLKLASSAVFMRDVPIGLTDGGELLLEFDDLEA